MTDIHAVKQKLIMNRMNSQNALPEKKINNENESCVFFLFA